MFHPVWKLKSKGIYYKMTSLPTPLKFHSVVLELFQNELVKSEGIKQYYTFSDLYLTSEQQKLLTYPPGFYPMNVFFLQQVDSRIGKKYSISLSMVSFVKKGDGYIYGYYFDVYNQPRFEICDLVKSRHAIELNKEATFKPINLLETYNNVLGKAMILSLNTDVTPYATLQYTHCGNYFYELITAVGVSDPSFPATELLGLSKNLVKYAKCNCEDETESDNQNKEAEKNKEDDKTKDNCKNKENKNKNKCKNKNK